MTKLIFSDFVKRVCSAADISSGFINLTVDPKKIRHYSKIDGIDVSQVTTLIECVTVSQIKAYGVDPAAYNLKNTDGLAGRFDSTRNYIFPLYALEQLFSADDYTRFYDAYKKAVIDRYDVKPTVKAPEEKTQEKKESKILSMTKTLLAPTSKRIKAEPAKADTVKADPVKSVIVEVIPMNAKTQEKKQEPVKVEKPEAKTEVKKVVKAEKKTVKAPDPVSEEAVAPVKPVTKAEEKKQEKPAEESKTVIIDANYIDNLLASKKTQEKAPAKKSKKASKKAESNDYEMLFV